METSQIFKNLKVVTPKEIIECSIEIEDGRIKKIKKCIQEKGIDLKNKIAFFNTVDMHVHCRDFREKHKETVETATSAAISGGITRIVDMPNTNPPILTKEIYEKRLKLFEEFSKCDFRINMGAEKVTPEIEKVFKSYNPPFLKIYLSETTGHLLFKNDLEKLFSLKIPIAVHGDFENVKKCVGFSKKYNTKLHICHISKRRELEYLIECKDKNITCEVTPHHLFLTKKDHEKLEPETYCKPQLASEKDRKFLLKNLKHIDCIVSDHAPHSLKEKEMGAFGISGVETMFPLMLSALEKNLMSIHEVAEKICFAPNKILKELTFGVGAKANFTVVDLKKRWKINALEFKSKAKHSPFHGWEIKGKVENVYIEGNCDSFYQLSS